MTSSLVRAVRGLGIALTWGALLGAVACSDSSATSSTGSGGHGSCAETPCKLVSPQCGCGDAQRCTVDGQGARYCTAIGPAKSGEACDAGTTDCVSGAVCVGLSTTVRTCATFCSTDADCGAALCARHLADGKGGQLPGISLCTDVCDPVAQTGCATGTACALLQEGAGQMRWFTQCAIPQGTATEGQTCATSGSCAPGLACAATKGGNVCHKLCDVKAGTGCTAPSTCVAFDTPVTSGTIEYGACQ